MKKQLQERGATEGQGGSVAVALKPREEGSQLPIPQLVRLRIRRRPIFEQPRDPQDHRHNNHSRNSQSTEHEVILEAARCWLVLAFHPQQRERREEVARPFNELVDALAGQGTHQGCSQTPHEAPCVNQRKRMDGDNG